ncbi:MAG: zinc-binding dehydrogenase [Leptolyngbyaceae cyanobacterium CSU_1_4]|nr:zinc-binding dehydrogenase [Leptolyngbyaceae cyanobacterium CSU_1_4]
MAIASGSFSEYVTIDAAMVIHKPEFLSMTAAATIPVAFLTAFYGLRHLAKMKKGDRVLVHAAAGGVGQAAIQLAQQVGAEVFATASLGKWETVRSMGVQHIFNSRSLNFADRIRELTQGEGIDIVLNSLAGEFVEASLSVLKPSGYFIDLGKGQLPSLSADMTYAQVDLVELCQQQPDLIQSMLQQIRQQFIDRNYNHCPIVYSQFRNRLTHFAPCSKRSISAKL